MVVPAGSRVGEILAGKYRLDALLGEGGMAEVFRAVNVQLGRPVAIKLLRPELALHPAIVERFKREARTANLVRHENVVDVVDIGLDDAGAPFIVQELLEGQDLAAYLASLGGRLPEEQALELLMPVVLAMELAHANDVVHRDLKPENVFLARVHGRLVPKLLDFGISRVRTDDRRVTVVGEALGTPAYMAPEQVRAAADADPRTDVWALGVMLFEILSGRLPFETEPISALFVAIATEKAPSIASVAPWVPTELCTIVDRCLRKDPAERYPSACELARDLRLFRQGEEIEPTMRRSIRPPPPPPPPASSVRSASKLVAAAAISPTLPSAGATPAGDRLELMPIGASLRTEPPSADRISLEPRARAALRRPPAPQAMRESMDAMPIVGVIVIAVTMIGVAGTLMTLVYRPEGVDLRAVVPALGARAASAGWVAAGALGVAGLLGLRASWRAWSDERRAATFFLAAVACAVMFGAAEMALGAAH